VERRLTHSRSSSIKVGVGVSCRVGMQHLVIVLAPFCNFSRVTRVRVYPTVFRLSRPMRRSLTLNPAIPERALPRVSSCSNSAILAKTSYSNCVFRTLPDSIQTILIALERRSDSLPQFVIVNLCCRLRRVTGCGGGTFKASYKIVIRAHPVLSSRRAAFQMVLFVMRIQRL
jgi:hypothetical protein